MSATLERTTSEPRTENPRGLRFDLIRPRYPTFAVTDMASGRYLGEAGQDPAAPTTWTARKNGDMLNAVTGFSGWRAAADWLRLEMPLPDGHKVNHISVALLNGICARFMREAETRPPDELIPPDGDPANTYMRRWYLRRSRDRGNRYLHEILRSDDDRALHDHPWNNTSLILSGSYLEHTPEGVFLRRQGDIVKRRAGCRHRLQLIDGAPVWSLFFTGPKIREWGFYCDHGWVHHDFYGPGGCDA